MTFDLELYNYGLQSPASYGHKTSRLVSWFKNRVETNGRTDRTDCITFLANAVGKELEKHLLDVPLAILATCSSCDLEL